MEATLHQQIVSLIDKSQKILLCTHRKPDGDAVGSIMAMYKALTLMGKEVTAACADQLPEHFNFLPEVDHLSQDIGGGRDFVITLDCDQTEVDRLKYHLEDNKIHIVVTPKKGKFHAQNVSCQDPLNQFDLIITVDVADIPQLGSLYEENADLFQTLPVINIDHHISNTEFGKLNLIDVSASSTAEILYGLIRQMEQQFNKQLIVADTATFLLSGVTTDTGSFQNANTTPRSMEVAAELMDAGANQHDVVKYLFRTKKLSTLKLWGKILTKIEVDAKHKMVWSSITQQDLKASQAHMDEAGDIIDELLVHAPEAEIVALFKEDADQISVSLRSKNQQANVMEIAQQFGGGGHIQAAGIKFPGKTLPEVMTKLIAAIQEKQRGRLGVSEEEVASSGKQEEIVTQVLDGYTPATPSVSPTLEQRVQPAPGDQLPTTGTGAEAPVQVDDIHHQTKAAIHAEQSQASGSAFSPSQEERKARGKPPANKRFTDEVPDYLKQSSFLPPSQHSTPNSNDMNQQNPPFPPAGGQPGGQQPGGQQPQGHQGGFQPQGHQPQAGGQHLGGNHGGQQGGFQPQGQQPQGSQQGGYHPPQPPQPPAGQGTPVPPVPPAPAPYTPPAPAPAAPQQQPPLTPGPAPQAGTPPAPAPVPPAPAAYTPPAAPAPAQPAPAPYTPPAPAPAAPANDGVNVTYNNAPVQAPPIPPQSAPPVVTQANPAPAAPVPPAPAPAAPQPGFEQAGGQQPPMAGGAVAGGGNPPAPPQPPKDPFALGDDGLTDIERALGNL